MILAASSSRLAGNARDLVARRGAAVTANADFGSRQAVAGRRDHGRIGLAVLSGRRHLQALSAPSPHVSAVRRARGWARSSIVTPVTVRRARTPDRRTQGLEPDVVRDDALDDDDQQQSDDRRDIDAAEVGDKRRIGRRRAR